MIAIVGVLSLTALCFGVLSMSVAGLWPYYVPAALVVTFLGMHIVDERNRHVAGRIVRRFPNLLAADEREMLLSSPSLLVPQLDAQPVLFSGRDIVGVVPAAAALALGYGLLSVFQQAWTPALLCAGLLLYSLLGPLATAFAASNHVDSEARALDRCRARLHRKKEADPEIAPDLSTCYWRTLDKLHSISGAVAQDYQGLAEARRCKLVAPAERPSIPD